MSLGGCFRGAIAVLVLEVLLTLCFCSAARLESIAASDQQTLEVLAPSPLGEDRGDGGFAQRVAETTHSVRGGLESIWSSEAYGSQAADPAMTPTQRGIDRIREKAHALLHLMALRAAIAREFASLVLACTIAAAIDGLAIRRRRAFTFATTSTVVYNAASYALLLAWLVPLLCVAAPVPMSMWAIPIAGLSSAAATWAFCAYLPGAAPVIGLRT